MTRRRSTYSMPGSSGRDDFRAKQEPQFVPVDDLSRFVADRIREAETEPVADQVEPNGQPMAYRYAQSGTRTSRMDGLSVGDAGRGALALDDESLGGELRSGFADGLA